MYGRTKEVRVVGGRERDLRRLHDLRRRVMGMLTQEWGERSEATCNT